MVFTPRYIPSDIIGAGSLESLFRLMGRLGEENLQHAAKHYTMIVCDHRYHRHYFRMLITPTKGE